MERRYFQVLLGREPDTGHYLGYVPDLHYAFTRGTSRGAALDAARSLIAHRLDTAARLGVRLHYERGRFPFPPPNITEVALVEIAIFPQLPVWR